MKIKKFKFIEGMPSIPQLECVTNPDGKRTYILPSGTPVPSVTTMLGHFKAKSLDEWRTRVGVAEATSISNRASTRGTRLHNLIEQYYKGNHSLTNVMPNIKQLFLDIQPLLNNVDNIRYIETNLFSEKLRLAGRTDLIADYRGELSIIDFKTSSKIKKDSYIQDYFLQSTAYALMYEELIGTPINQIVILISVENEVEPQEFVRNKNRYILSLYEKNIQYRIDNSLSP